MKPFFCLFLILTFHSSYSQVTVDPTFNSIDGGISDFLGARGTVFAQAIQSDGKILIGGDMTGYNGFQSTTAGNLIRLNSDGSRDASFGVTNGANGSIKAIAIQGDGKILIGGSFTNYAGVTVNGLCRLSSNGSFDPSFNPGLGIGSSNREIRVIKILGDGKIIIGGNFNTYNGSTVNGICKINADGSYDNSFNNGGSGFAGGLNLISVIDLQTDGKILVGGSFTSYNGMNRNGLIRLNANGTNDASFTLSNVNSASTSGAVYTINVRSDNKIWIGGINLYAGNGILNYVGILLLNSDGTNDASFSPTTGVGFNSTIFTITPIGTSKLFIGGLFDNYNGTSRNSIAIINTDGTLDNTAFTSSTIPINSNIYSSRLDASNNIIYSGRFNNSISLRNNNIEKLTNTYAIDASFNPTFGADGTVKTFATQPDGKIIIGGAFARYNNIGRSRLARLTENGELDNTFTAGTGLNNDVNDIAIQTNGNIIAVGSFTNYNTTSVNRIVRIDANGAIDATFATNIGTGANGEINTIALQTDGKIIIGGNFTSFNGNSSNYIARLNANGTFDNTFNIGTGAFGLIRVIRIQTDGKILLGGDFQFFNSSTIGRITRLNTDGTIDNTFNTSSTGASGPVYDIQIASNGSIFVGGAFNTYNGQTNRPYIVKLTSTGVLDNSFSVNSILYPIANINLYDNGKVLIVGTASTSTFYMQRLNSDRSVDNTFSAGSGTGSGSTLINKVQILGNGNKLLIAGPFTSFNGVGRNRIARLVDASTAVLPVSLQSISGNLQNDNGVLNWTTINEINLSKFTIQRSTNGTDFISIGAVSARGNSSNSYRFTDFNLSSHSSKMVNYKLKMQDKDGSFTYSSTIQIKLNGKTSISVSPNPTKDIAWLKLQISTPEKLQIRITDISGKVIVLQDATLNAGITSLPLNIANLNTGVYIVQVVGANRNENLKLIKE